MQRVLLAAGAWLAACLLSTGAEAADEGVRGLIGRIVPGHEAAFVLESISAPPEEDVFEVAPGPDGKIILRGNNASSMSMALNHYLKYGANVSVSWYASAPVQCPAELPPVKSLVRKTTRLKDRFFMNYCTFGYSLPWWQWRDWERLIDWMALNGINLPLAQNGNEAIWQAVWRGYGFSDEEIRSYFTGPAYLPWHRMANIDGWGGPIPQSYIDGQFLLQKKILQRERSLGMRPVLSAFAGHAPAAIEQKRPGAKVTRLTPWAGMTEATPITFVDPLDPLFEEIQVRFLREQEKSFGTDHVYGADPFNEMNPPSWEPAYLAGVSRAIYGSMKAADPQAVWIQMGWTFHDNREQWTNPRLKAMIDAVPKGRMILLDYVCEEAELFPTAENFFGAPFIWCYLGNFGGNSHIVGPIGKVNRRLTAAMNDPKLTNLCGVGATLEGLSNRSIYECLFERAWNGPQLDLEEWFRNNARSHAGGPDPAVEAAWEILRTKVLVDRGRGIMCHGVLFQSAPFLAARAKHGNVRTDMPYDNAALVDVWENLLNAGVKARACDSYQFDLADTTRQAFGNAAQTIHAQMIDAYNRKDAALFRARSAKFLEMGRDLNDFLACREEFLLGKWTSDARSWGKDAAEADYCERISRNILSTWFSRGAQLVDYASRCWNGMLVDYYLARWDMYLKTIGDDLDAGKPTDFMMLEDRVKDFEWQWAQGSGGSFRTRPEGDVFAKSRALFVKYADVLRPSRELPKPKPPE